MWMKMGNWWMTDNGKCTMVDDRQWEMTITDNGAWQTMVRTMGDGIQWEWQTHGKTNSEEWETMPCVRQWQMADNRTWWTMGNDSQWWKDNWKLWALGHLDRGIIGIGEQQTMGDDRQWGVTYNG